MIKIEGGSAQATGNVIKIGIETVALIDVVLDVFKDSMGPKEAVYFLNEMIKLGVEEFTNSLSEEDLSGINKGVPHEHIEILVEALKKAKPVRRQTN